jgi:hypothetical protein
VPPPRSAPVHASTAAALQRAPSAIRFSRSACFALKRAFLAARSLASFARSLRVKPPGSLSFLSQATCGAPFYVYSATTSALLPEGLGSAELAAELRRTGKTCGSGRLTVRVSHAMIDVARGNGQSQSHPGWKR